MRSFSLTTKVLLLVVLLLAGVSVNSQTSARPKGYGSARQLEWDACYQRDARSPKANWRDSLTVLNRQIAQQPQSTDLRLKKAAVNIELEQWEYAVEEYGRVLELDAENLSALYFRAYAYNHLHRYDMARADYEHFLHIMPRNFDAQLGLAMTKRNLGKVLETQDELNRLVEMYPDSALAFAARAGYEAEREQYDLALFDWDEALRLQPGNQDYMVSKCCVLWAMKRYDEARRLQDDLVKAGISRKSIQHLLDSQRKKQ